MKNGLVKFLLFFPLVFGFSVAATSVEPQPGSERAEFTSGIKQNHWIVLGALKRISGSLQAENEVRLDARVSQTLWRLPSGVSVEAGFSGIVSQLNADNVTLYECDARGCGMSNDYANQVFSEPMLYGRDNDQLYWVGYNPEVNFGRVWVVYANQRTNKGVYAVIEKIDLNEGESEALKPYLKQGQYRTLFAKHYLKIETLGKAQARLSDDNIEWLNGLLRDHPVKRFALVVHRYDGGDQQSLLDKTEQEANALRSQLAEAGGFVKNVYTHGAGAMMPRNGKVARIELVELTDK
ncbi:DUF4892 domain-containing protein [Bermanella sp. R86510]|uniref:DUF4892 domain-containing protein n=1 Tax=unclassified Bermanella TaxID=2627862 RepID=UPI0037CB0F04